MAEDNPSPNMFNPSSWSFAHDLYQDVAGDTFLLLCLIGTYGLSSQGPGNMPSLVPAWEDNISFTPKKLNESILLMRNIILKAKEEIQIDVSQFLSNRCKRTPNEILIRIVLLSKSFLYYNSLVKNQSPRSGIWNFVPNTCETRRRNMIANIFTTEIEQQNFADLFTMFERLTRRNPRTCSSILARVATLLTTETTNTSPVPTTILPPPNPRILSADSQSIQNQNSKLILAKAPHESAVTDDEGNGLDPDFEIPSSTKNKADAPRVTKTIPPVKDYDDDEDDEGNADDNDDDDDDGDDDDNRNDYQEEEEALDADKDIDDDDDDDFQKPNTASCSLKRKEPDPNIPSQHLVKPREIVLDIPSTPWYNYDMSKCFLDNGFKFLRFGDQYELTPLNNPPSDLIRNIIKSIREEYGEGSTITQLKCCASQLRKSDEVARSYFFHPSIVACMIFTQDTKAPYFIPRCSPLHPDLTGDNSFPISHKDNIQHLTCKQSDFITKQFSPLFYMKQKHIIDSDMKTYDVLAGDVVILRSDLVFIPINTSNGVRLEFFNTLPTHSSYISQFKYVRRLKYGLLNLLMSSTAAKEIKKSCMDINHVIAPKKTLKKTLLKA
jgi:hypothetical protein